MTTEAQVRAARNPQEAMIAIAKALDALSQVKPQENSTAWGEWEPEGRAAEITGDEEATEIKLLVPSEEKQERRRQYERQHLKLAEHLGDGEDWTQAYARGGPLWLYLGNRELVMSYPDHVRASLVKDVLEDSPDDAHEMGRDVLKQPCEDGPGSVAMRANDQIQNVP